MRKISSVSWVRWGWQVLVNASHESMSSCLSRCISNSERIIGFVFSPQWAGSNGFDHIRSTVYVPRGMLLYLHGWIGHVEWGTWMKSAADDVSLSSTRIDHDFHQHLLWKITHSQLSHSVCQMKSTMIQRRSCDGYDKHFRYQGQRLESSGLYYVNVTLDRRAMASCQIRKMQVVHAPGMPGTFSLASVG